MKFTYESSGSGYLRTFKKGEKVMRSMVDIVISSRYDKAILDKKYEVADAIKEILDQVRGL